MQTAEELKSVLQQDIRKDALRTGRDNRMYGKIPENAIKMTHSFFKISISQGAISKIRRIRRMKKVVSLLLALVMVLSLAACGGGDDKKEEKGETFVWKKKK